MPNRIFNYLHREFTGLHEAAFLLGGSAFLSQVLALLRDRLLAATFGSSTSLDVYYAAFKIPDFLFASIASFVSVTVLIPFIVERLHDGREKAAREFLNTVFTAFFAVMALVCAVMWFIIPALTPLTVPGFSASEQTAFIMLSRILLLSPLLLGLSNLLGSVTQAYKKFLIYALTPVVYNFGIIIGIVLFYPWFGLPGLAYGVILGALLHVGIQLPLLSKLNFFPEFTTALDFKTLKKVVLISLPRTFALATDKISLLILVSIASLMGVGSISIFNLALNLQSVPLAIVGVSYAVAAFPALAQIFQRGNREEFLEKIGTAVRHVIFWSLPATMVFIVLRAQIIRVLYGAGQFNWSDTQLTAAALALFSISVVAQSLILLFVRGYYAGGKTYQPLIINVIFSILTILFALLFMQWVQMSAVFNAMLDTVLRGARVSNKAVLTLPLAYSLGDVLNAIALWWWFARDFGTLPKNVFRSLMESIGAAVIAGYITYGALAYYGTVFNLTSTVGVFSQGVVGGLVGVAVTVLVLKLLKNEELGEIEVALRHKFLPEVKESIIIDEQV